MTFVYTSTFLMSLEYLHFIMVVSVLDYFCVSDVKAIVYEGYFYPADF